MAASTFSPSGVPMFTTEKLSFWPSAVAAFCSLMNHACSGIFTRKPTLSGSSAWAGVRGERRGDCGGRDRGQGQTAKLAVHGFVSGLNESVVRARAAQARSHAVFLGF